MLATRSHVRLLLAALQRRRVTDFPPLVVGGHEGGIGELARAPPAYARQAYAGSFTADPRTATPAVAREMTERVIDR